MAWASVGSVGTTGNATANSTIVTVTLTGQVGSGANAGDVLIANVALRSGSSVSGVDEGRVLSVADSGGNVWQKVGERTACNAGLASTQGVLCSMWWSHINAPLTTVNTVSATLGSSTVNDNVAMRVWRFTHGQGSVRVANSTFITTTSSACGAIDQTQDGTEFLRFRAIGAKTTILTLTTSAGWTAVTGSRSQANSNPAALGEFIISSASTIDSAPSVAGGTTATFSASIYAVFEDCQLMGGGVL
jgi:hypothetical protein